MLAATQFRQRLLTTLAGDSIQKLPFIDVRAAWLHELVGECPGQITGCRNVMESCAARCDRVTLFCINRREGMGRA
jgi:hypothetical protein